MAGGASSARDGIELSILASAGDLPFLEATLHHQLRAFSSSSAIGHRVLVLDLKSSSSDAELLATARRFLDDRLVDEIRPVDWSPDVVRPMMERWYGDELAETTSNGRAIYQYVFSVESATTPRLVHLDSDVLFHGDMGGWVRAACELLDRCPDAAAVVPTGALPQATRLIEWMLGRRVDRPNYPSGWRSGSDLTSRGVLLDRHRINQRALPLPTPAPREQWERTLGRAFSRSDLRRYTLVGDRAWMIHPHRHNATHALHLEGLIDLVVSGRYPYRRFGKPWDITTEGWKFIPWRALLMSHAIRANVVRPRS